MASRTDSPPSVVSLLRRYLQVYWLKPFDAVNDTANTWALRQFEWERPSFPDPLERSIPDLKGMRDRLTNQNRNVVGYDDV